MQFSDHVIDAVGQVRAHGPRVDLTNKDVLIANLVFVYHLIRASENLLHVAIERSDGELKAYYAKHLTEERSHEQWLRDDLATAGIDVETTTTPLLAAEAAGVQYYLLYHADPVALLGYIVALECFPMPIALVEQLEQLHGPQLLRTVRHHATHDIEHGGDVAHVIDALPPDRQVIVAESAIQTANYLANAAKQFDHE